MNAKEFDKLFSEIGEKPEWVMMHPSAWNGYWSIKKRPKYLSRAFRFLGRKLKNRGIYWIGLPLYWIYGLKTWKEFEGIEPEVVYEERISK